MALSYTEFFGNNTRLTESLCQLYAEIIACQGMRCWDGTIFAVTNLGEIGDARHQAEPTSRHNPMACPDGVWRICACDFGGLFAAYTKLAMFWQALYQAGDDRVAKYGFAQFGDGYGIRWPGGERGYTGRDVGHTHIDVNMADSSLANYSSFTPSMTSRRGWNLAGYLLTGWLTGNPTAPIPTEDLDMSRAEVDEIKAWVSQSDTNNILGNVVPKLVGLQGAVDRLAAATSGLFSAGDAVFTQVEGGRAWVSWPSYYVRGMPPAQQVSLGDPLMALPVVGPQPSPARVVKTADRPDVYLVQGGVRLHLDPAAYTVLGRPKPEILPATDAALKLPEVSRR